MKVKIFGTSLNVELRWVSLVLKVYSTKKVSQRKHAWARDNLAAKPQLTERAKKLGSYTEREFSEADRENFLISFFLYWEKLLIYYKIKRS